MANAAVLNRCERIGSPCRSWRSEGEEADAHIVLEKVTRSLMMLLDRRAK
jgi:hypothetical protein